LVTTTTHIQNPKTYLLESILISKNIEAQRQ